MDKPVETDLHLMWGCIVWQPSFTEFLHQSLAHGGPTDFAGVMNAAIASGLHARGVRIAEGNYTDVGTYDEIARLEREYRG